MKTAISVPDETFARVDEARRRLGLSRSEFYATAARRWLTELEGARVTAQIDAVLDDANADDEGAFTRAAAQRLAQSAGDTW